MRTLGLDTSVVVRLLVGEPVAQAEASLAFVQESRSSGIRVEVCDLVAAEAYHALCYHYRVPKAEALDRLRLLLEGGLISPGGHAGRVLRTARLAVANPGFVDRLIHAEYQSRAARMVSFESAAAKLPDTVVLPAHRG